MKTRFRVRMRRAAALTGREADRCSDRRQAFQLTAWLTVFIVAPHARCSQEKEKEISCKRNPFPVRI